MQTWTQAQEWEKNWHKDCANSYQEESKQIVYAKRMGLKYQVTPEGRPVFDFENKSVIDIGGGPYSILLKGINMKNPTVVDPLDIPQWCKDRYKACGIKYCNIKAEDKWDGEFDVGIIYNCLQHTDNPKQIIQNMRDMCEVIYIHEWLETPISDGHIQSIHEKDLNEWLGGKGMIGQEVWGTTTTPYYYGMFLA